MRRSVLVISAEPVAERMAGPAIRAVELARALAAECDVTLAAPAPSSFPDPRVSLLEAGPSDFSTLLRAARSHEIVVAQELSPTLLERLASLDTRLVVDLYNPIVMEVLEAVAARSPASQRRITETIALRTLAQCAAADLILCASERQRDMWLGGMAFRGLLDVPSYRRDPTLRSLIEVVPFGIPDEPPAAGSEQVMKGVMPGIGSEDRVLLWAGGIWSWLDAVTPIRAVERLQDGGMPVHLVFMGMGRPGLEASGQAPFAATAREAAGEAGLTGRVVHFNEGWVPYAERGRWLAEADVGVSAHRETLEARFAYRTRILDYLWAGLPVVTSSGDALGDLVESRGTGRTVAPGDVEGYAAACSALLEQREATATRKRIDALRPALRWSEVTRPLVDWCTAPDLPPPRARPLTVRRATLAQYVRILPQTVADQGGPAALARVGRRVRRSFLRD